MPIYRAKVTGGSDFDGLTPATGLFRPGKNSNTGSKSIQVLVRSLNFHAEDAPGPAPDFEIRKVDPTDDGDRPLLLSGQGDDAILGGFMLPTEDDGEAWGLAFTTDGVKGDAWLTVDFDFVGTEG